MVSTLFRSALREVRHSLGRYLAILAITALGVGFFSGLRMPDRKKLLNLALAMHLTAAEAQGLLKCAGYPPLYVKRPFDCIVLYGFQKQLSTLEINEMLLEYEQETLV